MRIARIDKNTNVVLNLEIADHEWINENSDDKDFIFVDCTDFPVLMGSVYDPTSGNFITQNIEEFVPLITSDEEFLQI